MGGLNYPEVEVIIEQVVPKKCLYFCRELSTQGDIHVVYTMQMHFSVRECPQSLRLNVLVLTQFLLFLLVLRNETIEVEIHVISTIRPSFRPRGTNLLGVYWSHMWFKSLKSLKAGEVIHLRLPFNAATYLSITAKTFSSAIWLTKTSSSGCIFDFKNNC